jgi:hypothetical protein
MKRNIHRKLDYSDVLNFYYPESVWKIENDSTIYENIFWISTDIEKPTKNDLDSKYEELKIKEAMRLLRVERDRLIAETDWWVLPDRTPTAEQLAYRQALRDLPDTSSPVLDPTSRIGISGVSWPEMPQ